MDDSKRLRDLQAIMLNMNTILLSGQVSPDKNTISIEKDRFFPQVRI